MHIALTNFIIHIFMIHFTGTVGITTHIAIIRDGRCQLDGDGDIRIMAGVIRTMAGDTQVTAGAIPGTAGAITLHIMEEDIIPRFM